MQASALKPTVACRTAPCTGLLSGCHHCSRTKGRTLHPGDGVRGSAPVLARPSRLAVLAVALQLRRAWNGGTVCRPWGAAAGPRPRQTRGSQAATGGHSDRDGNPLSSGHFNT